MPRRCTQRVDIRAQETPADDETRANDRAAGMNADGQLPLTGRIGSRRQLAENVWLVSLGCSRGPQWSCRVHRHIIRIGFDRKSILLKIGRFSLCAYGNGVNLPHAANHAFDNQMGPNGQKVLLPGGPSHQMKNCGLSQKIIFDQFFLVFFCRFALLALF